MEFCLIIDLTVVGNQVVIRSQVFATRYVLLLRFIPVSKYLLFSKKLISNTEHFKECVLLGEQTLSVQAKFRVYSIWKG